MINRTSFVSKNDIVFFYSVVIGHSHIVMKYSYVLFVNLLYMKTENIDPIFHLNDANF